MIAAFKRSLQAAGGIQAVQQAAVVALPALCRAKRQKLDPSELAEVLALTAMSRSFAGTSFCIHALEA